MAPPLGTLTRQRTDWLRAYVQISPVSAKVLSPFTYRLSLSRANCPGLKIIPLNMSVNFRNVDRIYGQIQSVRHGKAPAPQKDPAEYYDTGPELPVI